MSFIPRRNLRLKASRAESRDKPQRDLNDQHQLQLLLFNPSNKPKSLDIFKEVAVKKPKSYNLTGVSKRPMQRMSEMEVNNLEASIISFMDDKVGMDYPEIESRSRADGSSSTYTPRTTPKPMTVKMPNTLPPVKFPKIETQPSRRYYIQDLITALDDESNSRRLAAYRDQFEELCRAVSIFQNVKPKNSNKINIAKQDTFQKTVILDLDETLVHTVQIEGEGNCIKIPSSDGEISSVQVNVRPYCQQFLAQLSRIAEVVIFTASSSQYANAVIDHLDPDNQYISHRLYREHCTFQKNYYIKDLKQINRKPNDMVIVDNSPFTYALNLDNAIPIIPYYDNPKDTTLKSLLRYLREVIKAKDTRDHNRAHFRLGQYSRDFLSVTQPQE